MTAARDPGDPGDPSDVEAVLAAARRRALALAQADAAGLRGLLHPEFTWTTHLGEVLDRAQYVARNTERVAIHWTAQDLGEPTVTVVGDTAVLHTTVSDSVETSEGAAVHRMPMTQTWVRDIDTGRWTCLAGHAGPRLTS